MISRTSCLILLRECAQFVLLWCLFIMPSLFFWQGILDNQFGIVHSLKEYNSPFFLAEMIPMFSQNVQTILRDLTRTLYFSIFILWWFLVGKLSFEILFSYIIIFSKEIEEFSGMWNLRSKSPFFTFLKKKKISAAGGTAIECRKNLP